MQLRGHSNIEWPINKAAVVDKEGVTKLLLLWILRLLVEACLFNND